MCREIPKDFGNLPVGMRMSSRNVRAGTPIAIFSLRRGRFVPFRDRSAHAYRRHRRNCDRAPRRAVPTGSAAPDIAETETRALIAIEAPAAPTERYVARTRHPRRRSWPN